MAKTIKEIMQEVVNLDFNEKVILGKNALSDIISTLKKHDISDDNKASFIFALIKLFVSADKRCSEVERKLVNAIADLDISYDDFYEFTNNGADPKFVEEFDDLIDTLNDEEKNSICIFGLCILSADDTITAAEQQLFLKILN